MNVSSQRARRGLKSTQRMWRALSPSKRWGAFLLAAALTAGMAQGLEVTLTWDPPPGEVVAGYKIYYRTVDASDEVVLNVGNVTQTTVTNLTPGVTYSFHVTAYDACDNESLPSNGLTWGGSANAEFIWIEAEEAYLSEGAVAHDSVAASAGQFVLSTESVGADALFSFDASGGRYYLWALVELLPWDKELCKRVSVGGETNLSTCLDVRPAGQHSWSWGSLGSVPSSEETAAVPHHLDMAAGHHTLRLSDIPYGMKIDAIILTTSATFDPSNSEALHALALWEIQHMGRLTAEGISGDTDSDRDGLTDYAEYLLGTDPKDPASLTRLSLEFDNGQPALSFTGIAATGPAYDGLTRRYTVERKAGTVVGAWVPVASLNCLATGKFTHIEDAGQRALYRLRVALVHD